MTLKATQINDRGAFHFFSNARNDRTRPNVSSPFLVLLAPLRRRWLSLAGISCSRASV